jgi:penicillin-insensitive murein DD-endopeptidase
MFMGKGELLNVEAWHLFVPDYNSCVNSSPLVQLSAIVVLTLAFVLPAKAARHASDEVSKSHGTPSQGRLEKGQRLPFAGQNFRAYSRLGYWLRRTYVHSAVRDAIIDAYAELRQTAADVRFLYGETGWPTGERFRPHRTHQNGLSVDFIVPVVGADGKPDVLSCHALNKWCYGLEFDEAGRTRDYAIDFDAVALHLTALQKSAAHHGLRIRKIIFDAPLQKKLIKTSAGKALRLPFQGQAWIRHDEHYHVDFEVLNR